MNRVLFAAAVYILFVALASLAGVSFVSGGINLTLALLALLACSLVFVGGVSLLAKRLKLRSWLRASAIAAAAVLSIPLAAIEGLILASASLAAPDYQEEVNGLVCRGFTFGDATVRVADERTEVAVFRPMAQVFERRLGSRTWRGNGGTPFTSFQNECAILHAQHVG